MVEFRPGFGTFTGVGKLNLRSPRDSTMGSAKEYWECARECAQLAVETKDREAKSHLLDMARAWTELALLEPVLLGKWAAACHQLIVPRGSIGEPFSLRSRIARDLAVFFLSLTAEIASNAFYPVFIHGRFTPFSTEPATVA
jgi:hypothetical protein